jgi:hypothetical protein
MIMCHFVLIRITDVSDKSCRESQNTHLISITCFRNSCLLWDNVKKNTVEPGRSQLTIPYCACAWHAGYLRLIDTHLPDLIFMSFPGHQWLRERASLLCHTYTACLDVSTWFYMFMLVVSKLFMCKFNIWCLG